MHVCYVNVVVCYMIVEPAIIASHFIIQALRDGCATSDEAPLNLQPAAETIATVLTNRHRQLRLFKNLDRNHVMKKGTTKWEPLDLSDVEHSGIVYLS
jgi:hypothetical protein